MTRSSLTILAAAALAATASAQTAPRQASLADAAPRATIARSLTSAPVAVSDTAIEQLQDFLRRYPNSALRPNALFQLGELLVRRADEQFNAAQRSGAPAAGDSTARADAPIRPDYAPAITTYEELVRRYPDYDRIDAAAYTLGTLYSVNQRYADAVRMFTIVAGRDSSRFNGEAQFRLGDAQFELASKEKGTARQNLFAQAATAYERATTKVPANSDLYFLSLYKLGWSYYNQATLTNRGAYDKAVSTFGTLVDAYDKLTPEQQSRLGLRGEAIEYMAVAFTQVGGAEAANKYFESTGRGSYKLPVLRRVAQSLRDQGDFSRAVDAYQTLLTEAPTDSTALAAQREIVDIYQNRTLEPEKAQAARLVLIDKFAPNSAWAQANPAQRDTAQRAREDALRQSGQYLLAAAQKGDRAKYAEASSLYGRYVQEFGTSDSAQAVNTYYAEALFGQGNYAEAGAAYSRAAYGFKGADSSSSKLAEAAGRNAVVAFDSALSKNKADRGAQDSLFSAVDRYVAANPSNEVAKKALIEKGRRASETQRWDVMATAFRDYATKYPNDPYTPTAQKLVGDALYKGGQYGEAQTQWLAAQQVAKASGRSALADSIVNTRAAAASMYADTLIKRGDFKTAAEQVYVAYADANAGTPKAADALRNAIETYMLVVDSGKSGNVDEARSRAIELSARLVREYPTYKYRSQYQNLNARLLAQSGRKDEAITALRQVITDTPKGTAQADAMVRLAGALDSAGQKKEAAAAYEAFAAAYPTDKRAADAQNNAAVTYADAGDPAAAAKAYNTFATRFPRDPRAGAAREQRIVLLRTSGDSATATAELSRLCSGTGLSDAAKQECANQRAARAASAAKGTFDRAVASFADYQATKITITSKARLTAAGIKAAQARKLAQLNTLTSQFKSIIASGSPQYVAAGTYYVGLVQYEYGQAFKNIGLPSDLSPEELQAAQNGAAGQAEQYFKNAQQVWQALIDKADQDDALKNDKDAKPWLDRARDALKGNVSTDAGE